MYGIIHRNLDFPSKKIIKFATQGFLFYSPFSLCNLIIGRLKDRWNVTGSNMYWIHIYIENLHISYCCIFLAHLEIEQIWIAIFLFMLNLKLFITNAGHGLCKCGRPYWRQIVCPSSPSKSPQTNMKVPRPGKFQQNVFATQWVYWFFVLKPLFFKNNLRKWI